MAALAYALIQLYQLHKGYTMKELSALARIGSGSACRSFFGGFVLWKDLMAMPVTPIHSSWSSLLQLFILVQREAAQEPKKVSSTLGMTRTLKTSALFKGRRQLAHDRLSQLQQLLAHPLDTNSWHHFCRIVMQDAMSFHALCLDTFPPLHYLNDTSFRIIDLVHE
jgi:diphosphomevalonate decarboxylase